jgi:predicted PurR-regulated permease PerM
LSGPDEPPQRRDASLMTRMTLGKDRVASHALIFFGIGALFLIAWQVRYVLLLLFGAVIVAVVLKTAATPFRRIGLPHGPALTAAVFSVAGLLVLAGWLVGSEVADQASELADMLPDAWEQVETQLADTPFGGLMEGVRAQIMDGGIASSLGQIGLSVGRAVIDLVIVVVAGIYIASTPESYRTGLLKMVPKRRRALASDTVEHAGRGLSLWLRGQLIQMVLIGTITAIGLTVIGVPSALTLGILAGLLEFVPFLGPIAAAIPALLLAATLGVETLLWTLGFYLFLQQLEGNLIQPMVQKRAVSIPPVVLLFAILLAAPLFGIPGILLAAPLAVFTFVLVKRLYVQEALDTPTRMPGDDDGGKGGSGDKGTNGPAGD